MIQQNPAAPETRALPAHPALNPWTTTVRISETRLRIVTADRRLIDLSAGDSADLAAVCELLDRKWPAARIRGRPPAWRGLGLLAGLNQLVDADLISSGPGSTRALGRALTTAALGHPDERTPTPGPAAPDPLPPLIAVQAPRNWHSAIRTALGRAGMPDVVRLPDPRPAHLDPDLPHQLDRALDGVSVVLIVGELDWPLIAALSGLGQPHLLITPGATSVRIGPLVLPGATPCLRCVHLARSEEDRWWPITVEALRARDLPPLDPLLLGSAALAAAALTDAWLSRGALPAVALTVSAPLGETASRPVAWHPGCGCRSQPGRDGSQPGRPAGNG